jgi:hypothetical protein
VTFDPADSGRRSLPGDASGAHDAAMTEALDVMIIESHPGAAASAVHALEAAGHRIHRCHDEDSTGFPCRGLIDPGDCPVAAHVDVALLVRDGVAPQPAAFEQGATCAIRAGVPLVEDGPAALDPYEPWLAARVPSGTELVTTCEAACDASLGELHREIVRLCAPTLVAAGIPDGHAVCRVQGEAAGLHVEFILPITVSTRTKQALAVRVLDAVRGAGRTYGPARVSVHAPA